MVSDTSPSAAILPWFAGSAGVAFAVASAVVAIGRRSLESRLSAADGVTMTRLGIACIFVGLAFVVPMKPGIAVETWTWFVLGAAALGLDGLDGWLARRNGTASAFGARFDMEVDAFLILVLSVVAAETGKAGAWVLASGLARYVYVALGTVWTVVNRPLAQAWRRKCIAVVQGATLVALLSPLVVPPVSTIAAACALALLMYSFGRDIGIQMQSASHHP